MPVKTDRASLLFYLRLAFAIALLLFLFSLVDLHKLAVTLSAVKPGFIVAALAAMLLNYCLKTYRWALMLQVPRPDFSLVQIARLNFLSIFFGNFLPSNLSSDVVRVYYITRQTSDAGAAVSSIFADRVIGNFAVAIATAAAFLAVRQSGIFEIGSVLSYGIVVFLLLSIVAPMIVQHSLTLRVLKRVLERFTNAKIFRTLQDIPAHLVLYRNRPALVATVVALAFANLFMVVFEFYFIAESFSAQISLAYFFLFVPLLVYLSMLPISIGGIGLLEGGLVFFFSKAGMPLETCLSMALLFRVLQLACALPGAMIYLLGDVSYRQVSARC